MNGPSAFPPFFSFQLSHAVSSPRRRRRRARRRRPLARLRRFGAPLRSARFPWATFAVNVSGCALIGILTALALRFPQFGGPAKLFLVTGFCGGFTTFSTFSLETFELLRRGECLTAALYAGASFLAGLLALGAAFWLAGGARS